MTTRKRIVICQSGGKFTTKSDGSLSYTGGEAHAISVNNQTKLNELKIEIAEMWKYDPESVAIKYFLPNNNRTLITISSDKDIQRMIDFHEDAATIDVYVTNDVKPASYVSTMPCSGSSRTTMAEPGTPLDTQFPVTADPVDSVNTTPGVTDNENDNYTPLTIADSGGESYTPISMIEPTDSGQKNLTSLWKNCITGLHQQFNNVHDLRDALRKYSAAQGFLFTYKNNDGQRLTAKCKAEGCPWRLHASKLTTTQFFRIKKINSTHTCGAGTSTVHRPHASKKLIVSLLKEKLRDSPNSKPREIAKEIKRDFGIDLRYYQAWRGLESVRVELQGSYKDAYNQLPLLCEKIMETNPGSLSILNVKEDSSFHRIFIAFHASLHGFRNGCRPIIFLNTYNLKSKYQSELLTASGLDGNDGIFPIACSVVDLVNNDNWHWFLVQLESALSTVEPITFVFDRKMGLKYSISSIFENSHHAYCLQHLIEELKENLEGPCTNEVFQVIIAHFYEAAFAATENQFTKCIENIKSISPEACNWVLQNEPRNWANAFFSSSRYNHFSSNADLAFYSTIPELQTLPISQMIDAIRRQIMELIYTRRMDSNQWLTKLTPVFEEKLQKDHLQVSSSNSLQVLFSSTDNIFEVHNEMGEIYFVNTETGNCSCRIWLLTGLPCLHALAVLQRLNKDVYEYCSRFFLTETFRAVYSESVNPISTVDMSEKGEMVITVNPPPLRNQSGQPKKRRDRSKGKIKRPLRCSRCKGVGHNRATCHIPS